MQHGEGMGTERKFVSGDIRPIFNFGDPNRRYANFIDTKREAMKRFLESFITHDKVVIPTDDYMSLAIALSCPWRRASSSFAWRECN